MSDTDMSDMPAEASDETIDSQSLRMEQLALDIIAGSSDLATAQGITESELEAVYAVAYNLYSAGKYGDAGQLFRFLSLHRHMEPRYWMGLGAAEQLAGHLPEALEAYALCAILDESSPQPSLRAGECFRQQGNSNGALKALEACLLIAEGDPKYQDFIDRAQQIIAAIHKEGAAS